MRNTNTARSLRRKAERAARKPETKRRPKGSGLFAISRSTSYDSEEFARLSNEVRLSWHRMCTGEGTTQDYDNLAFMVNVTDVLSEPLGKEPLAIARAGGDSLAGIKLRYLRTRKFGVDGDSLRDIPPTLDLYDEFLRVCTPLQMTKALKETLRRLGRQQGEQSGGSDG